MHHRNSQDIQDGIDSLRKDSKASTGRLAVVQRRVEEMKETVDAGRYRVRGPVLVALTFSSRLLIPRRRRPGT
ncbi:MAG: hypothetical protein BJ554DRAFT_6311, partial [Olpidium bornovanus]